MPGLCPEDGLLDTVIVPPLCGRVRVAQIAASTRLVLFQPVEPGVDGGDG